MAKLEAPAAAYNAAIATAVLWAKWIMDYAAIWDPRCPEEEERGEEGGKGGARDGGPGLLLPAFVALRDFFFGVFCFFTVPPAVK